MRLYESLGGRARTRVTESFEVAEVRVCDLLERDDAAVAALGPVQVNGSTVELSFAPFQVVTLGLRRPAA